MFLHDLNRIAMGIVDGVSSCCINLKLQHTGCIMLLTMTDLDNEHVDHISTGNGNTLGMRMATNCAGEGHSDVEDCVHCGHD